MKDSGPEIKEPTPIVESEVQNRRAELVRLIQEKESGLAAFSRGANFGNLSGSTQELLDRNLRELEAARKELASLDTP